LKLIFVVPDEILFDEIEQTIEVKTGVAIAAGVGDRFAD
jgi:hypothetical protein